MLLKSGAMKECRFEHIEMKTPTRPSTIYESVWCNAVLKM